MKHRKHDGDHGASHKIQAGMGVILASLGGYSLVATGGGTPPRIFYTSLCFGATMLLLLAYLGCAYLNWSNRSIKRVWLLIQGSIVYATIMALHRLPAEMVINDGGEALRPLFAGLVMVGVFIISIALDDHVDRGRWES